MHRLVLISLVVAAGCAKKEAARSSTSSGAGETATSAPSPTQAGNVQPIAPVIGGTATPPSPPPGGSNASDHAKSDSVLGPTTDTHAFDPIEGGPGTGSGQVERNRKQDKGELAPAAKTAGPPDVRLVAVTGADGKPASAALDQALRTRVSEVKACFDKFPGVTGQLELTFTVAASGGLTGATVKTSTLKKVDLEACVIGVVQRIKLLAPPGAESKAAVTFAR